jgi:hypothetical protein
MFHCEVARRVLPAAELATQIDRADLVLAGKLREHRCDDILDVAFVVTEVVEQ